MQLNQVEQDLKAARQRRQSDERTDRGREALGSRTGVDQNLEKAVRELARTSFDFAHLMRRIIPEFVIRPVQALDSGLVRPRGALTLRLAALGDESRDADASSPLSHDVSIVIDLFEPAAHIRAIPACLAAKQANPKLSLDQLAGVTGYGRMTVRQALAYARLIDDEGLDGPYRELKERPQSASRWTQSDAS